MLPAETGRPPTATPRAPPSPRAIREAGGVRLCLVAATALPYPLLLCFHLKQAGDACEGTDPSVSLRRQL